MNTWLRGRLKNIFGECVLGRKDLLGMPISESYLRRMLQQHLANEADHGRSLWTLLSLALWEQKHYRSASKTMNPDYVHEREISLGRAERVFH